MEKSFLYLRLFVVIYAWWANTAAIAARPWEWDFSLQVVASREKSHSQGLAAIAAVLANQA